MKRLTLTTGASFAALFASLATPAMAQQATSMRSLGNTPNDSSVTAPVSDIAPTLSIAPAATPHHHHFDLGEFVDDITIKPLTHLYRALPHPVRGAVHNVLSNLDEPDVAVNDLAQLHPLHALEATFRFAANTTLGMAGIFDVARHVGATHHDNDAATTLAYYRIGEGPHFYVPIIETENAREAAGFAIDFVVDPLGWGRFKNADAVYAGQMVMDAVDDQAQANDTELASISDVTDKR